MGENKKFIRLHGIQLESLNIVELSIKLNEPPDVELEISDDAVAVSFGHSKYNEEDHSIQVGVKLGVGSGDKEKVPFSMRIELFGVFRVDEDKFDKKYVTDWARKNAPYTLMPYLREQAYALSTRVGLPPLILPLAEIPPYTMKQDVSDQT